MKYTEVIYLDDVLKLLEHIEDVINEDELASTNVKAKMQEFIYEFEKGIKSKLYRTHIADLRSLNESEGFFPAK